MRHLTFSIFILCLSSPCLFAQSLIVNGGFETATKTIAEGGTSLPAYPVFTDGWSAVVTDGELIKEPTLSHNGNGFLSLLQNAGANPQESWLGTPSLFAGYDKAIQIIPADTSADYVLDFYAESGDNNRYDDYGDGYILVQVEQTSPAHEIIDSFIVYTPETWEKFSFNFSTESSCSEIALMFSSFDVNAVDAWIDDISLNRIDTIQNDTTVIDTTVVDTTVIDTTVVDTTVINSILQTLHEKDITVYPNPASDVLHIHYNSYEALSIAIYNSTSSLQIKNAVRSNGIIDISKLPAGTYLYQLYDGEKMIKTGKFVRQ